MTPFDGPVFVTGGTGNVGREVVRALVAVGAPVRMAVHRSAWVTPPSGVTAVELDFRRPATFAPALKGVRRLFLMRPNPVLAVKSTLNRLLDAAAEAGVEFCAFLSVAGADRNRFVPHHAVEQHLRDSRIQWTMLRPAFFAQNLSGPYRKDIIDGTIFLPAGSGRVTYVDAYDIGDVAARVLLDPKEHVGQAYHLTGKDSLTFHELAALLTEELARPVTYHPASLVEYWRHCNRRGYGLVESLAYTGIHASLRGGSGAATDLTLGNLLQRSPRTVRQFIAEHRAVWTQASPS